ncbi:MAG: phosphatase PAP2 family protein, partial [Ktedonobacteraceae bacterium]
YSFPSGHVVHDVVLYGFLLYVSFSEPVRSWRYRWLLLPLQLLALLYLLSVGLARLQAGEHLLLDVLGGYLLGLLWLSFFIFLDRRIAHLQAKYRQNKIAQQSMQTQL